MTTQADKIGQVEKNQARMIENIKTHDEKIEDIEESISITARKIASMSKKIERWDNGATLLTKIVGLIGGGTLFFIAISEHLKG